MTQQDGPAEIDRTMLRVAWCPWCKQRPTVIEGKDHDATCSKHPAVQQLAVAKQFIADLADNGFLVDFDHCVQAGILIKTTYDPALHGAQDAEVGETWYVIAEAWRA